MNKQNGFTIIELLITLTIIMIVLNSAIPQLNSFYNKIKADEKFSTISMSLKKSRTLAITNGLESNMTLTETLNAYSFQFSQNNVIYDELRLDKNDYEVKSNSGIKKLTFKDDGLSDSSFQTVRQGIEVCNLRISMKRTYTINSVGLVKSTESEC
ncbi:Tfp pilus assembly protein FimT/FimU [Vibrio cyclitrophicus]